MLETQRMTFQARRNSVDTEIATIEEGIKAIQERIQGSKAQVVGVHEQLELLDEEIEGKTELLNQSLIRKSDVLLLRRAEGQPPG